MLSSTVKAALEAIVGRENLSFEAEDLLCYSFDATNRIIQPEGVIFPASTEEISEILTLACKESFPVTPRGAGSGITGGAVPVDGGIVLSTERLNRILKIDGENLMAIVEPGVITGDLQREVEAIGLFYPPDPSSLKFSTIGGNIGECAGGPRAVKYGVTRDYVMGLEVVLPTGEVVETGVKTVKGVVGYDLTRLMVGSEGTLGIVTKAVLRLVPKPESVKTLLAEFPTIEGASRGVASIIGAHIIPSTLELLDGETVRCVEENLKIGLPKVEGLLLIEVDGVSEAVDREGRTISKLCKEAGADKVRIAETGEEVAELWRARRTISPSLHKIKPNKTNEDVVVPRSRIVELLTGIGEIAERLDLKIANFGHAGDGNIHVNIMYDKSDEGETARMEQGVEELFKLTLSLEGTISGEHGVGTSKAPYLDMELSKTSINTMKRLKSALDPKGILNPGKIF